MSILSIRYPLSTSFPLLEANACCIFHIPTEPGPRSSIPTCFHFFFFFYSMKFFAVFSLTVAFSFSLYAVVKIEIPRIFMQLTVLKVKG